MNSALNFSKDSFIGKPGGRVLLASALLLMGFIAGHAFPGQALESAAKADSQKLAGQQEVTVPIHKSDVSKAKKAPEWEPWSAGARAFDPFLGFSAYAFEPWGHNVFRDLELMPSLDLVSSEADKYWPFPAVSKPFMPRVDMSNSGDELKLTVEVPGIDDKHLDLDVSDDAITIKGEKIAENSSKNEKGVQSIERSYGSFERTIALPCKIDSEKASAVLKNGVLTISAPKDKLAQKDGKKISIKTES